MSVLFPEKKNFFNYSNYKDNKYISKEIVLDISTCVLFNGIVNHKS